MNRRVKKQIDGVIKGAGIVILSAFIYTVFTYMVIKAFA